MKLHKQNKNQKGFTLIETLVAVLILMIAIAGPLSIADKGLTDAIYARDQVTGAYLAQDEVEYIRNVRDDNLLNNRSWLTYFSQCTLSNPCSVDTTVGNPSTGTGISICNTSCPIYSKSDGTGYTTNSSSANRTQFSRYFYIVPDGNNPDEAKIVAFVTWVNGKLANQVTYEDEIFNVIK